MSEPEAAATEASGKHAGAAGTTQSLPPELERRLTAIESEGEAGSDFNAGS